MTFASGKPTEGATTKTAASATSAGTRPASMRAAVFDAPGSVCIRTIARPEPGEGEVRVRLEGSGLCGSNLPVWEGTPWLRYPLEPGAPGHEGWGRIDAIGGGVETVRPGDRVALFSAHAFSEFDLAREDAVVPLPSALDDTPVPGEALGCAWNVFRRSGIARGQDVAVIGLGFLGLLVASLAVRAGARVIGISRRPFALELGERFGVRELIPMVDQSQVVGDVTERTGGNGCECVIEAVGHQWSLDLASEIIAFGGRLIVAGYHQDGPRRINMQHWNWRGIDVINAHERDSKVILAGMREAIRLTADGELDPAPLYTHRFRLEDLPEAMETARRRPGGFLKALIEP